MSRGRVITTMLVTAAVAVIVALVVQLVYDPTLRLPAWVGLSIAALFAGLCVWTFRLYAEEIRSIRQSFTVARLVVPLLWLLALLALSTSLTVSQESSSEVLATAGSIFFGSMACVSIVAFVITITRLEDIQGRIQTYSQLMARCGRLARDEKKRVEESGEYGRVLLLANAPALGIVSTPRLFETFEGELAALIASPRVKIQVACLSWEAPDSGASMHDRFYRSRFSNVAELESKIQHSGGIIQTILTKERSVRRQIEAGDKTVEVTEIRHFGNTVSEAPYHMFMTSARAIVFLTLSFPEGSRGGGRRVEVVGFETGDAAVLAALERGFRERFDTLVGEVDRTQND